jgi:hypothetical protein
MVGRLYASWWNRVPLELIFPPSPPDHICASDLSQPCSNHDSNTPFWIGTDRLSYIEVSGGYRMVGGSRAHPAHDLLGTGICGAHRRTTKSLAPPREDYYLLLWRPQPIHGLCPPPPPPHGDEGCNCRLSGYPQRREAAAPQSQKALSTTQVLYYRSDHSHLPDFLLALPPCLTQPGH